MAKVNKHIIVIGCGSIGSRHAKNLVSLDVGVHIDTMHFGVLEKMLANTMTDTDLNKFLSDWENVPGKDEAFK
jgi:ketol-acid reductoisomerase